MSNLQSPVSLGGLGCALPLRAFESEVRCRAGVEVDRIRPLQQWQSSELSRHFVGLPTFVRVQKP